MWYVLFYNEAPILADYCNCLKEICFHSALKDTSVWSFSYNVWNFYDPVKWSRNKAVFLQEWDSTTSDTQVVDAIQANSFG